MIFSCTGHRPSRSTFPDNDPTLQKLTRLAVSYLKPLEDLITRAHTGMATGWDTAFAQACIERHIPFTAVLPFVGQELRWSAYDQQRYLHLLRYAQEVHVTHHGPLPENRTWLYYKRNSWLVDNCTDLVCLWDKRRTGGTYYTVEYAKSQKRPTHNLWGEWKKHR